MKTGLMWLGLATGMMGVWMILLKKASDGVPILAVQTLHVGGTVAAVVVPVILLFRTSLVQDWHWGQYWYLALIAGVLIGSANLCTFKAFETVPISIVAPVLNISCVVPAAYGLVLLRERIHPLQGVGLALALVAALLITYPYPNHSTSSETPLPETKTTR